MPLRLGGHVKCAPRRCIGASVALLLGANNNVTPADARSGSILTQGHHLVIHPVDLVPHSDILSSEALDFLDTYLLHHYHMLPLSMKLLLESLIVRIRAGKQLKLAALLRCSSDTHRVPLALVSGKPLVSSRSRWIVRCSSPQASRMACSTRCRSAALRSSSRFDVSRMILYLMHLTSCLLQQSRHSMCCFMLLS